MNIYLEKPPIVPNFGLFAAKCTAICCKTQCVLVQNALHFGAKWKAFWCKTQGILVQNAVQNVAKCESKSINIQCKWYKQTFSKH